MLIRNLKGRGVLRLHLPAVVKSSGGNARMTKPLLNLCDVSLMIESVCRRGGRGRDSGCPEPPAQIPAGGTTAPGSYLE